jgi:glycosyltransferase involved in cell wall biosynthesis
MRAIRLLYVTDEAWPTFRPDIVALFGKYLPRSGVMSDIVTQCKVGVNDRPLPWGAGATLLCSASGSAAARYVVKLWHNVCTLIRCDPRQYDAIQVRDMPVSAVVGLAMARFKRIPFFYWMSFPQSEGQVLRAKARGPQAGLRYWFPLIQGMVGQWLLYRLVLPGADHVFVQSEQMILDLANRGIAADHMTSVPMGVDLELMQLHLITPSEDVRLEGKLVLVYLGTLDRTRSIEMLFHMLAIVLAESPNAVLVLAGDTEDADHRGWLKREALRIGVMTSVIWTGWLPTQDALRYVRTARVGLSPFPRGFLLDSASPTKAIEYMALGVPVVVNDNPDQKRVVDQAECGLCVELDPAAFARAVLTLLNDPGHSSEMGAAGRQYVAQNRGYDTLAASLATSYRSFFDKWPDR